MARDRATRAASCVELSPAEARLVGARERPIVIAPRRPGAPVADAVAPGLRGPRRDAALHAASPPAAAATRRTTLVMTSGNVGDEPIA